MPSRKNKQKKLPLPNQLKQSQLLEVAGVEAAEVAGVVVKRPVAQQPQYPGLLLEAELVVLVWSLVELVVVQPQEAGVLLLVAVKQVQPAELSLHLLQAGVRLAVRLAVK
jgi:hypothetical protein